MNREQHNKITVSILPLLYESVTDVQVTSYYYNHHTQYAYYK